MTTNLPLQTTMKPTDQTLVTPIERQSLLQRLNEKRPSDIWAKMEKQAYEKSSGVRAKYLYLMNSYHEQVKKACQNNLNQTSTNVPMINNTVQYVNQPINLPQQSSVLNHSQHQLTNSFNQQQPQPRFTSIQLSAPTRMPNPSTTMINNQSIFLNQNIRTSDSQKFTQMPLNPISYSSTPPTIQKIDLGQTYRPQLPPSSSSQSLSMNNVTVNDYLAQPSTFINRLSNQSSPSVNQRTRPTMNPNDNFNQQTSTTNSNNILQQYIIGNSSMNTNITSGINTSLSDDRILQQILGVNNNNNSTTAAVMPTSNKSTLLTRQITLPNNSTSMPPSTRLTSATNSANPIRPPLATQQVSPSPSVVIIPTPTQTSNSQPQLLTNLPVQHSPLNNSNPSVLVNLQSPSVPNNSSPVNRTGNGSISSPDEETIQLIKYFKENINKLQAYYQKFINEGNLEKARNAQGICQQMNQFVTNPTYESLPQAKHIRDVLERAANRTQLTNSTSANVNITSSTSTPSVNQFQQLEKVLKEFINSDSRKRRIINRTFNEPLSDVINGVPHKKLRLDINDRFHYINEMKIHSSLINKINDELHLLPIDRFSVQFLPVSHAVEPNELNDEYLSKNGLVLRCKLIEVDLPLVPILRLRIFPRYPDEQPEILSLTKTMPPKLESTDGHPFFEQFSTNFISHLFKLPVQHTVTDILNLWYQSIRSVL